MKKILSVIVSVIVSVGMNAQVVKVYENGSLSATYTNSSSNKVKVVFEEASAAPTDPNLLTGKFSVSDTKQVQFTRGNLYWDGSAWHFEANQTDYPTTWSTSHVSHFFWSNNASVMYAETYSDDSKSTSDAFFFCEANKNNAANKVDGASGYYLLTEDEWIYLFNRTNVSTLYKYGVTVTNGATSYDNCLIIAPDDFTGTLQSSYTLDDVNSLGLVCLPAAGNYDGSTLSEVGSNGYYWVATSVTSNANLAYGMDFGGGYVGSATFRFRYSCYSVRLVK